MITEKEVEMSNNVVPLESAEEEQAPLLSREVVVAKLMSAGVNQIFRSYEPEAKEVYRRFVESDLSFIAPCWPDLNDHVKIEVLNTHREEFLQFVNGG